MDAKPKKERPKKDGWPHSGTDSWVKEHSDAPPPPDDESPADAEGVRSAHPTDDEAARKAARRVRRSDRRREEEELEERSHRRHSRREPVKTSEGSQGDHKYSRRESQYVEELPRTMSASRGGSWWKKIPGL
jgi:hypothetical protein